MLGHWTLEPEELDWDPMPVWLPEDVVAVVVLV